MTKTFVFNPVGQCDGKHQYPDKKTARWYLKKRFGAEHDDLGVYICPHCFYYHIGHKVFTS